MVSFRWCLPLVQTLMKFHNEIIIWELNIYIFSGIFIVLRLWCIGWPEIASNCCLLPQKSSNPILKCDQAINFFFIAASLRHRSAAIKPTIVTRFNLDTGRKPIAAPINSFPARKVFHIVYPCKRIMTISF